MKITSLIEEGGKFSPSPSFENFLVHYERFLGGETLKKIFGGKLKSKGGGYPDTTGGLKGEFLPIQK